MSNSALAKAAPPQTARAATLTGDRLDLVETFIRIAETGGIGAAARSMGATQPTVTRRLQQFEAMLGAKLVERGPSGLSLTPLGAKLLPEARELAGRWVGLEDLARGATGAEDGPLIGRVRVTSNRSIGAAFLPPIIADFLEANPEVRVDLRYEDGGGEIASDLAGDGVDFAIRTGRAAAGQGEASREIARIRRALFATPQTAERIAERCGVAIGGCEPLALEGEGLVHTAAAQAEALRFTGRDGETLDVRFEPIATVDDDESALDLALSGVGMALLPTWRAAPLLQDRLLTPVALNWTEGETPVSLAWAPSRFRSAAAMALLEIVAVELSSVLSEP